MNKEIPYLNVARVIACIMVVFLHCLPTISLSGIDSKFYLLVFLFTRPCVPIFFMITGILLLPFKGDDINDFYKKKISRILFPLLFWGIVYSILPKLLGIETLNQMLSNLFLLIITYPQQIGGILWYLYILIGLYLIIPFINSKVFESKKMLFIYLFIWLVASLVIFLKIYFPHILGSWSSSTFDMLHYFSGYLGYLFLGYYINHFISFENRTLQSKLKFYVLMFVFYCLSMISIAYVMKISIVNGSKEFYSAITAFLSFPVIIMTACFFIAIKNWDINVNGWLYKIIKHLSPLTFGIYLVHMLIIKLFMNKVYEMSTSPLFQIFVMITTFIGAYILTLLFSKIPYSKYIIG